MIEGVDYSFARPGGAALVKAGKKFACRYLTYSGAPSGSVGKFLTNAEVVDLHAHGISIVANFESLSTRALSGAAAGRNDGLDAKAALAKLGFPTGTPVYFSVDFDASLAQQPTIDAYLRAAGAVLGAANVGVYGSYALITRCHDNKSAAWFWQTYAWSYGHVAKFAHLLQYLNGQNINGAVDLDHALQTNYGQWAPKPVTPPKPAITTHQGALGANATIQFPVPIVVPGHRGDVPGSSMTGGKGIDDVSGTQGGGGGAKDE